jgi:hypothetical protein
MTFSIKFWLISQNIKLFQISTNFIITIIFEKLLTLIKFTLWADFFKKKPNSTFLPSVDFGATVDHYNVLKSCFRVLNLITESNLLSKSGLRTKNRSTLCRDIATLSSQNQQNLLRQMENLIYFLYSLIDFC